MSLYKFSPIESEVELQQAIAYVYEQSALLCEKVVSQKLPSEYVTIFTHYETEYVNLINIINGWGESSVVENGTKTNLNNPITVGENLIRELRIRKPDPYRMQVGCCDFTVNSYQSFKNSYLSGNKNLRVVSRPTFELIEFFDPDFDVLAYVSSA
jgi:hypothetical protein